MGNISLKMIIKERIIKMIEDGEDISGVYVETMVKGKPELVKLNTYKNPLLTARRKSLFLKIEAIKNEIEMDVEDINQMYSIGNLTIKEIADKYNVSPTKMSKFIKANKLERLKKKL